MNEALGLKCVLAIGVLVAAGCADDPRPHPAVVASSTTQTLVDAPASDGARWSVRRSGNAFVVDHPGKFQFSLPTSEAQSDGWTLVEASDQRVRLTSSGQPSDLTVYADGRAYCDGEFKSIDASMRDANEIAAEHQSPAEITVAPQFGRLDRNTPGDADNDGYNESCGAYEIAANGPRLELTIAPHTAVLSRPVLEIINFPAGAVQVTIEGELIAPPRRLSSGHVLIELPARLKRLAVVNINVSR